MPRNMDSHEATFSDRKIFWQTAIQEWQQSGLKQHDFCKQRDIGYSTFQYWRSLLKQQLSAETQAQSVGFKTVSVHQSQSVTQSALQLKIKTQQFSIEVYETASPQILITTLKAIGIVPC